MHGCGHKVKVLKGKGIEGARVLSGALTFSATFSSTEVQAGEYDLL